MKGSIEPRAREAALLLHGLGAEQREAVLARLDPVHRETLRPLLGELTELGIPASLARDAAHGQRARVQRGYGAAGGGGPSVHDALAHEGVAHECGTHESGIQDSGAQESDAHGSGAHGSGTHERRASGGGAERGLARDGAMREHVVKAAEPRAGDPLGGRRSQTGRSERDPSPGVACIDGRPVARVVRWWTREGGRFHALWWPPIRWRRGEGSPSKHGTCCGEAAGAAGPSPLPPARSTVPLLRRCAAPTVAALLRDAGLPWRRTVFEALERHQRREVAEALASDDALPPGVTGVLRERLWAEAVGSTGSGTPPRRMLGRWTRWMRWTS